MPKEAKPFLDANGFRTKDGHVTLRDSAGLSVGSVGDVHRVEVYSTKDHKMHVLEGQYSSEDAALSVIDSHNRSIRSSMVEESFAPASAREIERHEARKIKREAENKARKSSTSIYLD